MDARGPVSLCPHLFVRDADAAVRFYAAAFGAAELLRTTLPDGRVLFVELGLGPATRVLLSEEERALGVLAPPSLGGSPVMLTMEIDDVDAAFDRALGAGATAELAPQEMFWDERYGIVRDPYGHRWALS